MDDEIGEVLREPERTPIIAEPSNEERTQRWHRKASEIWWQTWLFVLITINSTELESRQKWHRLWECLKKVLIL